MLTPNAGYKTYIAILYLEFTQNNPIANCFVQILLEECAAKNDKPTRCKRTCLNGKSLKYMYHGCMYNKCIIMFLLYRKL